MLAEDKGVDALGANLQFLRQQATQAGGIQPDAGAQHLAARQAGKLPYLPGDDVAGLVATRKMPLNPLAIIVGTMLFTIFAVEVSSSSRLWPARRRRR